MLHTIVKTENYLVAISDRDIYEGDYIYNNQTNEVDVATHEWQGDTSDIWKKIIAHLPLNGSTPLQQMLLPPLKNDAIPTAFNGEMLYFSRQDISPKPIGWRTYTNFKGQKVWVGNYIY
jgi:hypothetical protein